MAIYSSTIKNIALNKMPSPFYKMDGSDCFTVGTASSYKIPIGNESRSVSMWFKASSAGSGQKGLIGWGSSGISQAWGLLINTDDTLGIVCYGDDAFTGGNWRDDTWHHVVATHDRVSGDRKLYIDGIFKTSDSGTLNTGDSTVRIGSWIGGSYFLGDIKNVKIWNSALSTNEIADDYADAGVPYKYKEAKTVFTSNYSANNGNWTAYGSNSLGNSSNIVSIAYVDHSSGGYHYLVTSQGGEQIKGKRYKLTITAHVNTGGITVGFNNGGTYSTPLSFTETSATTKSFEWTARANDGDTYIYGAGSYGSGEIFYITDLKLEQIGVVTEWDGSGISSDKWFDKSGNDTHITTPDAATIQNAPSGDSGLVYEEGTFNSTPMDFETGGSVTMVQYTLHYVRIGKAVFCGGNLYTNVVSDQDGSLKIPLPFVNASGTQNRAWSHIGNYNDGDELGIKIENGASYGILIKHHAWTSRTVANLDTYIVSFHYLTD